MRPRLGLVGAGGGAAGRRLRSHGRRRRLSGRALAEATATCIVSAGPGGRAGDRRVPPCPRSPTGCDPLGPRASFLWLLSRTWGRVYRRARPLQVVQDRVVTLRCNHAPRLGQVSPCSAVKEATAQRGQCLVPRPGRQWRAYHSDPDAFMDPINTFVLCACYVPTILGAGDTKTKDPGAV